MINISNINNIIWKDIKISVLGAGKSGLAATKLALSLGAKVLISENDDFIDITTTPHLELETGGHSNKILNSDIIIIKIICRIQNCNNLVLYMVQYATFKIFAFECT